MKLVDMQVKEFVDVLASDAPAPGGGSAAALEGAVGVSLATMVASLTIGKKKYDEHQDLVKKAVEEGNALKAEFVEVVDRDTNTFNEVSAVFSMPKETEEDKAARKEAMQTALKHATIPPYDMMVLALKGLELTNSLVGKSNQSAASDLGVASVSLKAAVQGAWLNVLINISGINDEAFVSEYRKKGEDILKTALPLADNIFNSILETL